MCINHNHVTLLTDLISILPGRTILALLVEGLLQSSLARAIAAWLFTLIVEYSHLHWAGFLFAKAKDPAPPLSSALIIFACASIEYYVRESA